MKVLLIVFICIFSFVSVSFSGPHDTASPAADNVISETAVEPAAAHVEEDPEDLPEAQDEPSVSDDQDAEAPEVDETPAPLPQYLDPSYFDDVVFIGDSVMGPLWYYADQTGGLGESLFFYEVSYSAHAALDGSVSLKLRGHASPIEDIAYSCEAGKLYIMLGVNDLGIFGVENTIENMTTILNNVVAKCPDIKIVLISATPAYNNGNGRKLTNDLIREYNQELIRLAEEKGFNYVDITKDLTDEKGDLIPEYSKDKFIHMIIDCGPIMADALKDTANYSHYPES